MLIISLLSAEFWFLPPNFSLQQTDFVSKIRTFHAADFEIRTPNEYLPSESMFVINHLRSKYKILL
jgi:hypothetical protein